MARHAVFILETLSACTEREMGNALYTRLDLYLFIALNGLAVLKRVTRVLMLETLAACTSCGADDMLLITVISSFCM